MKGTVLNLRIFTVALISTLKISTQSNPLVLPANTVYQIPDDVGAESLFSLEAQTYFLHDLTNQFSTRDIS